MVLETSTQRKTMCSVEMDMEQKRLRSLELVGLICKKNLNIFGNNKMHNDSPGLGKF